MTPYPAPELQVSEWLNTSAPVRLSELRGNIVLIEVFQMLCPGCIMRGLPLAMKLHDTLGSQGTLTVLGLHSVFEHHAAMQRVSLEAFVHEFRYTFPIGIDVHDNGPVPRTMREYNLRGTPSLIVIDRQGFVRDILFGRVDELALGVQLGKLLHE